MSELKRVLGVYDLTLLTVGGVIGSGIFIVPAVVLRATNGDFGLSMLVWFLAGVLSLLGALTYGELSATHPEAGGLYVYIRDAFGRLPAFLFGWSLFFVIASCSVAALSVAFVSFLRELVPVGAGIGKLLSIVMILTVMAVNVRGTRNSADVQNYTTVFKAGALLLLAVFLLFAGGQLGEAPPPLAAPTPLVAGVLAAMVGVLWAYEGWQFSTYSAGEVVDPQRTFPRGIIAGTAILVALYCLANAGYVAALGPERAMASERIAADAVNATLGATAAKLLAIPVLVAMFSAANSIVLTAPRVFYAMARDGVFFARLAEVHPRFGTPAVSIVAMSAIAIVFSLSGTFDELLGYVVFSGWIFYALAAASIFVYRRREPNATRPFRVPGYPITPLLFVLAAAVIVVNFVWTQPTDAAVGIVIVLAGVPAYWFWRKRVM